MKDTIKIVASLTALHFTVIKPLASSVAFTQGAVVGSVICCTIVLLTVALGLSIKKD